MYKLKLDGGSVFDFSVGGMYRDKKRDSFFNEYTFNSATGVKDPQYQERTGITTMKSCLPRLNTVTSVTR